MHEVFGYIALGFLLLVVAFIWWCILGNHEMTPDQILWMEERGKQQMRDAGYTEEEIDELHWKQR